MSATFRPSDAVDFVVVGAGAAGGVVAKELSTAGFKVVVLEQGPWRREKDFVHDEIGVTLRGGLINGSGFADQSLCSFSLLDHRSGRLWRTPAACSKAAPIRNTSGSSKARPAICIPKGGNRGRRPVQWEFVEPRCRSQRSRGQQRAVVREGLRVKNPR